MKKIIFECAKQIEAYQLSCLKLVIDHTETSQPCLLWYVQQGIKKQLQIMFEDGNIALFEHT